MTRNELISQWTQVAQTGSLLTPKHDPSSLAFSWASYRSVLSADLANNLAGFLKSGQYDITHYEDSRYPGGSGYFELTPQTGSAFSIAGSGVPPGSVTPTQSLDRLILVFGQHQGWHAYAESSRVVSGAAGSGRLTICGRF